MSTAALLLAAGGGTRYDGPTHKLLAPFRGRTVVEWALANALAAALDEVIVVTGATPLPATPGVTIVHNERWASGLATSLRAGTAAARDAGHDAVVVGLGDQPLLEPEAWRHVAASPHVIAIATYDGQRGHPVKLSSVVWDEVPDSGDAGARGLIAGHENAVGEVPCPGSPADIDTMEDLARWS